MDTLSEAGTVRAMHPPISASTKNVLKRYLGEWPAGPKLYSAEKGHPRLRQRHMGFKIGEMRARCVAALHARRAGGDDCGRRCPATRSTPRCPSSRTGCATRPAILTMQPVTTAVARVLVRRSAAEVWSPVKKLERRAEEVSSSPPQARWSASALCHFTASAALASRWEILPSGCRAEQVLLAVPQEAHEILHVGRTHHAARRIIDQNGRRKHH